jgi:NAD-dependent DNA ligase
LNSIDEKLAILLYDHGFTSIESLKQASLKELRTIKGVTRKQINAIKKEVEKEPEWETIQYDHEEEAEPQVQPSKPSPNGWEPVEQEASFKEKTKEPIESTEEGTSHPEEIFKDIPSVDPPIAQLLFNHGITSIETLQQTTIKDLTKIRGIKRSVAKRIKQDLHNLKSTDKNNVNKTTSEPSEEPVAWEEVANEENDIAQSESNKKQGYRQGEFVLYKKEVTLSPGTTRTIHFFSKEQPEEGTPTTLPDGYEIEVNKRTGVPYIRKKR